jgi:hypothetical protein
MGIRQTWCPYDNSTNAAVLAWAKNGLNAALYAAGWRQTTDAGQIGWGTSITIASATSTGGVTTYTYTQPVSSTNQPIFQGMSVTVAGMLPVGYNGTYNITGVNAGAGTFTVASTVASPSSQAGTGAGFTGYGSAAAIMGWEMWRSQDALSATFPLYLKIEYWGNTVFSGGYSPLVRITPCTSTDGAGTCTGNVIGPSWGGPSAMGNMGPTVLYECDYSWYGSGASFACLLWRTTTNTPNVAHPPTGLLCFERSKDTSGNDTGDYWTCTYSGWAGYAQQSMFPFGSGGLSNIVSNCLPMILPNSTSGYCPPAAVGTGTGGVQMSPIFPWVGSIGNPQTMLLGARGVDVQESQVVQMQFYGTTNHNYLMTKTYYPTFMVPPGQTLAAAITGAIGIRWDAGA